MIGMERFKSKMWTRCLSMIALVAILAGFSSAAAAQRVALRAQPALLAVAGAHPDATVRVIVQKLAEAVGVEATVAHMGGVVTKDLSFINAFAADVPARGVSKLAVHAGVRWISMDAPMVETGCGRCVNSSNLQTSYIRAIGADRVWADRANKGRQDITVAVVDSGVTPNPDLNRDNGRGRSRVRASVEFGPHATTEDTYGHGTHIAGVIAGNGARSQGAYIGVAPRANLVNVKVMDDQGAGTISDVIDGLEWIYQNRDRHNIRVVNLSLNSSIPESYHTSPLNAAVEILWFNKIVVVVSAGNVGDGERSTPLTPPANDPFVITVGASDDAGTDQIDDDSVASFSAHGTTSDGFAKPDLVAPGVDIVSLLPSTDAVLAVEHPDHLVNGKRNDYFRMSGTSMAAPVVAGAVALLLEDQPGLTPDQVKHRLMGTANPIAGDGAGAGQLDIFAAMQSTSTDSANTGTVASELLWTGSEPVAWPSVSWSSVSWSSVSWSSVSWSSVSWSSVSWSSDYWDE